MSAIFSSISKLSPDCMPRPPEITIFAVVSSGRSDSVSFCSLNVTRPASPVPSTSSTSASPPSSDTASKAVPRTVMSLMLSDDCTVASALPA